MLISTGYVGVNIIDTLLDLEDFENPIKKIFNSAYTRLSKALYKEYHIMIRKGIVKTDKGWLYPEEEEKSFYSLAQEKEIVITTNEAQLISTKPIFALFSLRINNLQQVFERRYEKIQDVISNTGVTPFIYLI